MEEHLKLPKEQLTLDKLSELIVSLDILQQEKEDKVDGAPEKLTRLMHDFCCFLEVDDLGILMVVTEALANAARDEQLRMAVTAFEAMENTIERFRLYKSDQAYVIQCLRLIANLCYDSEEGRKRLIAVGGVDEVANVFLEADDDDATMIRVSAGCISNIASVTPGICTQLFEKGVMEKLVRLLDGDPDAAFMVIRALSNMCETEEINKWLYINGSIEKILSTAEQELIEDPDMSIELVSCISSIIDNEELCLQFFSEKNGLERLINMFIKTDDETFLMKITEILCGLGENDKYRDYFFPFTGAIYSVIDNGEFLLKKYGAAKLVAYLSVSEKIADVLFEHIDNFISLLQVRTEKSEFPIYAGMTISNLAMEDTKCQDIISRGVPIILLDLAKSEDSDIRLRHYCISALRNLTVVEQNKAPILELGVMEPAVQLLEQRMNAILIHNCLGLIKSLFFLEKPSFDAFVSAGGIQNTVPLFDMEDTPHVYYEAARVFCNISKSEEYHSVLLENNVLVPMTNLIKGDFSLLKLESLTCFQNLLNNGLVESLLKEQDIESYLVEVSNCLQDESEEVTNLAISILDTLSTNNPETLSNFDNLKTALSTSQDQKIMRIIERMQ
eukprot:TRINITY_DN10592_c0_g1_i1.p1 TRINITY_DN10592_c0_g1~~TRINITY_DN10592_c0_g1_i1.p1  ORF type:complete len:616 (+),score=133.26 TRINITY_DN10592_c0_g1_i1:25-1872(+)